MRRILPLFLIVSAQVFLSVGAIAQTPELACPSITVKAKADRLTYLPSSRLACPGADITFTAVLIGTTQNDKPSFNWTISNGEIISGQGTSTIRVSTDKSSTGKVTASVEVGNVSTLKAECDRQASAKIEIAECCLIPCPAIEVSCQIDRLQTGNLVPVSVNLSGGDPGIKPKYHWQVSAGKIISGQETPKILVDITDVAGQATIATVEVDGLPPECEKVRACSFSLIVDYLPARKYDEYGDVSWISEEARLTNFSIDLQQQPDTTGYLIIYGPGSVNRKLARARKFLIEQRGIDSNRIVLTNGGFNRKAKVELWIVPKGASLPKPDPTF